MSPMTWFETDFVANSVEEVEQWICAHHEIAKREGTSIQFHVSKHLTHDVPGPYLDLIVAEKGAEYWMDRIHVPLDVALETRIAPDPNAPVVRREYVLRSEIDRAVFGHTRSRIGFKPPDLKEPPSGARQEGGGR